MALFKVCHLEGTHYVDAVLNDETIRMEAGALSYMVGDIKIRSKVFVSPWASLKAHLADETVYRPTYTGTGTITLESSLGGFHVFELKDETWILEKGTYWASDGTVDVSFYRESVLTSLWAGEGFVYLQTKVKGTGNVVIATRGPVENLTLEEGQSIACDGRYVIARSSEVPFKIHRATVNFFGRRHAGEGLLRVFYGPGRVLLNPAPYWRYRMFTERAKSGDYPAETAVSS
jgi:uncharacterized protein (AIM24 family)